MATQQIDDGRADSTQLTPTLAEETWVWAVDPLESSLEMISTMSAAIEGLRAGRPLRILPATVANPDYLNWPQAFSSIWTEAFNETIRRAVTAKLETCPLVGLQTPTVISEPAQSRRHSARALISFAESVGARVILMSTHSRAGLERVFLGSFTETVIGLSQIPVLVVNPRTRAGAPARATVSRVLFPTDLDPDSKLAFEKVLEDARRSGARVILFHRIAPPFEPLRDASVGLGGASAGTGLLAMEQFLREDEAARRATAAAWLQRAQSLGVNASAVFVKGGTSLSESVVAAASELEADLIAVAFRSGPDFSGLFTSHPREIVREADRPVMIFQTP